MKITRIFNKGLYITKIEIMKNVSKIIVVVSVLVFSGISLANSAPEVGDVDARQRTDGSGIVD